MQCDPVHKSVSFYKSFMILSRGVNILIYNTMKHETCKTVIYFLTKFFKKYVCVDNDCGQKITCYQNLRRGVTFEIFIYENRKKNCYRQQP